MTTYDTIVQHLTSSPDARVRLATCYRVTILEPKHLPLLRASTTPNAVDVRRGKGWITWLSGYVTLGKMVRGHE